MKIIQNGEVHNIDVLRINPSIQLNKYSESVWLNGIATEVEVGELTAVPLEDFDMKQKLEYARSIGLFRSILA